MSEIKKKYADRNTSRRYESSFAAPPSPLDGPNSGTRYPLPTNPYDGLQKWPGVEVSEVLEPLLKIVLQCPARKTGCLVQTVLLINMFILAPVRKYLIINQKTSFKR